MTVLVNPSNDTMTVNTAVNIVSPVDSRLSNDTSNTIDVLSGDNSGNHFASDSNWSTNYVEDNTTDHTTVVAANAANSSTHVDNAANVCNAINTANGNSNGSVSVSPAEEPVNPDDALEPVERLEKYSCSDIIFHRFVPLLVIACHRRPITLCSRESVVHLIDAIMPFSAVPAF